MGVDELLKRMELEAAAGRHIEQPAETAEYTGGSVSYYKALSPRRCRGVLLTSPSATTSSRRWA